MEREFQFIELGEDFTLDKALFNLGIDYERVSFTGPNYSGEIPLLGDKTSKLGEGLFEWRLSYFEEIDKEISEYNPSDNESRLRYHPEIQEKVKLGSLLHGLKKTFPNLKEGKIYDLGCGLAISSLVYCLLGSKDVIAVDIDDKTISKAKELGQYFGCETIEYRVADVLEVVEELSENDLVFLSDPVKKIFDYVLERLGNPINLLIFNEPPKDKTSFKEFNENLKETVINYDFIFSYFPINKQGDHCYIIEKPMNIKRLDI